MGRLGFRKDRSETLEHRDALVSFGEAIQDKKDQMEAENKKMSLLVPRSALGSNPASQVQICKERGVGGSSSWSVPYLQRDPAVDFVNADASTSNPIEQQCLYGAFLGQFVCVWERTDVL
ncbi:unnamed protein product [Rhizoctonia solani]|nr:unnamed protein product [Rhizoctonia solani]